MCWVGERFAPVISVPSPAIALRLTTDCVWKIPARSGRGDSLLMRRSPDAFFLRARPPVGEQCEQVEDADRAVAVEIAQERHRGTEDIEIVQRTGEAPLRVADLLVGSDCSIWVEEQNPHRAAVEAPPVVIVRCAHGQIGHTIAIEIAQRGHLEVEMIVIIQRAGEAALGLADLLV